MSDPIALQVAGSAPTTSTQSAAPSTVGEKDRPQLARAVLRLFDPAPSRSGSGGSPGADRGEIAFQFNPKEVTIAKQAKWERKPTKGAKKSGPPEFSGSDPCKLTLEMFLDATGAHDASVVDTVEKLFGCCVPTDESHGKKKPAPPLVALQWGKVTSFPAFVTSVNAKYTLFDSDGTPIRALCSISLEEMPDEPWRQNPTSGGLSARRAHTLVEGDSLASVAYAEYGDPNLWRPLAAYNSIDDPLRVRPGSTLLVPAPEDLAKE